MKKTVKFMEGKDNRRYKEDHGEGDKIAIKGEGFPANPTIEENQAQRYNPTHLNEKGERINENLCSYHQGCDVCMKNSLVIINALYKKGLINLETLLRVEEKYGRVD